ncbi:MAG: glycosyltransferase family 39 protein [Candidatus Moranbacteria bacterium]|jgi:4-amino-4-deoxy-L-arabinose transferase-like glycosyltransferase|nr:glycosyltransferase family 39 protein [Candidatus Moranbacteria bacterium]MDD5652241.1 glycosyltransferase family 39 protein [Candidatus Moranbacteria bacterium]MDX9855269.1 glycosyltransferase family 39 protein [Candidatus Moranbacteria bacterium]
MDFFKIKPKNKKWLLMIVAIIFLSAFLRFYKLGEKSFVADEFLGVNTSYGYLQTGEWRRWDFNMERVYEDKPYFKTLFDLDLWNKGEDTYTRAWIYNWQIAQSLKFLPDDKEWSYRFMSVIWGIISVVAVYWVSAKMTGKKTIGIIAAVLMAVSIDNIEFSRKVRMYIMFMPVFFVFSYYAFRFIESKKKSEVRFINDFRKKTGLNLAYLLPVFLLGFLSMHLHLLAANFFFILAFYFAVMGVLKYNKSRNLKNRYLAYLAILFLGGWAMTLVSGAFLSGLGAQDHFSYFSKSFSDYSNPVLAAGMMVLGAYILIQKRRKEGIFMTSAYLAIFLGAVFLWERNTGSQYLFFIKSFQIVLIASGVWAASDFLRINLKRYNQKAYLLSIVAFLLVIPNLGYFFQEENAYTQTSRSSNPNYKKVFGYFIKEKDENDILIARNFRNFYWRGSKTDTITFGGERAEEEDRKLTLESLQNIISKNESGWLIYGENDEDFIKNDAQEFIEKNLEKVSHSSLRGPVSVYRWGQGGSLK